MDHVTHKKPRRSFTPKLIGIAAVLLVILIVLVIVPPFTTVPAGHIGIVTTLGRVEDYTFGEGFHLKNPIQKVIIMDNRTQKQSIEMLAFSSDIQQVNVVCSVNFRLDKNSAQTLYQTVGVNYYNNIMVPRIQEDVKAVFAHYSAENLMEVRNTLSGQVMELLVPEMTKYGIVIENVSIEDVDFTDAFTNAVEEKQVAEQTKLRVETEQAQLVSVQQSEAERRIIAAKADAEERTILANADAEVAKIEADAKAYAVQVQAEAEAEANQKISASLTDLLIQYQQAQNWNGQLPTVVTGDTSLPILDLTGNTDEPDSNSMPNADASAAVP